MYKKDLALYKQQWLMCHETKSNQTISCAHIFILILRFKKYKASLSIPSEHT